MSTGKFASREPDMACGCVTRDEIERLRRGGMSGFAIEIAAAYLADTATEGESDPLTALAEAEHAMHVAFFRATGDDPGPHATGNATCQQLARELALLGYTLVPVERLARLRELIRELAETVHQTGQAAVKNEVYKGARIVVQGNVSSKEYNGKTQLSIWADRIGLIEFLRRDQVATPAAVTPAPADELGF